MERILFVEDDEMIASGLIYSLRSEGFSVVYCKDVQSAMNELGDGTFALALLDLSLPDGTGFDIHEKIKGLGGEMSVIFLTAIDDEGNTVRALEMGADDYITKPFRIRELMARIHRTLGKRHLQPAQPQDTLLLGDVQIHTASAKVYRRDEELTLTALEYRLLLTFARNKGQVLSRAQILESIWDVAGSYVNDNTLSVYIKRLREKIGDAADEPQIIQTVRGIGYRTGK